MHITNPQIEQYLMKLSTEEDEILLDMEKIARERNFPIVDRLVGRLLFVLTKLRDPKLIVELGSGFGYSAYWFASAMEKGRIVLTDYLEGNIEYARKVFKKRGFPEKAEFRVGDATEIAKEYKDIDILFVDIDKHQYLDAVLTLIPNLNRKALVVADNSLWYGRVATRKRDRDTLGIKRFNEYMFSSPDFFTMILPVRDGVLVAYKMS